MLERVIRNIFSADSPAHRQLRVRDDYLPVALDPYALSGRPQPKTCSLGTVWDGPSGKSRIDAEAKTIEQLITQVGLTPKVLDMGLLFTGGMIGRLDGLNAAASEADGQDDVRDTTEVRQEAVQLRAQLESVAGGGARQIGSETAAVAIQDRVGRLRDAIARVGRSRTTDAVNPLTRLTRLTPDQLLSGPNSPENVRARDFHAPKTVTARAIGDSSGLATPAVRDALHAVNNARTPYELNAAANALAKRFWTAPT